MPAFTMWLLVLVSISVSRLGTAAAANPDNNCYCDQKYYSLSVMDVRSGAIEHLSLRLVQPDGHQFLELYTHEHTKGDRAPEFFVGSVGDAKFKTNPNPAARVDLLQGCMTNIEPALFDPALSDYETVTDLTFYTYTPKAPGSFPQPFVIPSNPRQTPRFTDGLWSIGLNLHTDHGVEFLDLNGFPSYMLCGHDGRSLAIDTTYKAPNRGGSHNAPAGRRAVRLFATYRFSR